MDVQGFSGDSIRNEKFLKGMNPDTGKGESAMEAYEKLREKLDLFPQGFPKQEETDEMLRLLFTEEEAEMATHLHAPPLFQRARRIARRAGVSKGDAVAVLDEMVGKALIMGQEILGETRYALLPAYPGFVEMQFMHGQELTENRKRAGELWHRAYSGEFGREAHGYATSGMRVIPVKKNIDTTQRVFSYDEAERIVKDSGAVAITKCACRVSEHKCDAPVDVCMLFGPISQYSVDKGLARKVSTKEALKVLTLSEDAGLMHITTNCKPPVSIICNCCTCCCSTLKRITVLNKPIESLSSNFVSRAIPGAECKKCKKCKKCVKACQMEAIEIVDDRAVVSEEKCIGCGVCVSKCRNGALTLKRNSDRKPFPSTFHLMAKMYEERGKFPRLLESMQKEIF